MDILNTIIHSVTDCGAVMIKFVQWITPKLELIYLDNNTILKDKDKPEWLTLLERYYENCEIHSLEYTKNEYSRVFETNVDDIYEFIEVIGSGSIGQVHLVHNKELNEKQVIKILHPDVKKQISYFRRFIKLLYYCPCLKSKLNQLFPVDIFEFINQFEMQTNLINESNHILHFYNEYIDNELVIIPKLIQMSASIIVMSYEPGLPFSELSINEYQKDKIVNLYHLFIRNNQNITNYNHGDLHPGNWKVRLDTNSSTHKLVIHDFGYCWRIPVYKYNEIGTIFFDTFEESNNDINDSIDNLSKLMYLSILYDKPDKVTGYKDRINDHVKHYININNITELTVIDSLKATIDLCVNENLLLDPIIIQCYIIFIQGQKLFEQYGLMTSDKDSLTPYQVYRDRYLNILTFCKTYNIFPKYSKHIETKLNDKQLDIGDIFDTINLDDSLKNLALKNLALKNLALQK